MADGLRVIEPGLFSSIQDLGRIGYQRFGISGSGALDDVSMRLANRLAGNPADTAVVEMTLVGASFVVEAAHARFAVAGGDFPVRFNGSPVRQDRAHDVRRGDRIALGAARRGARLYLAVAGGFAIPPVLGSRSTHSRSALGGLDGGALKTGDLLPLAAAEPAGDLLACADAALADDDGPIRVMLGPQADYFTDAGIATFLGSAYTVSQKADRMGCQLDGPVIEHKGDFNIVSDGIMNGSIQVPGHGRPIVLLADRQTTGGYPKIATVIGPDLPRLAQRRPGDAVRFRAVAEAEAETIAAAHRDAVAALLAAVRPAPPGGEAVDLHRLLHANLVSGVVSATGEPFEPSLP